MTRTDPLDGTIRQALAEVVAHAPLAPDFHALSEQDRPRRSKRLQVMTGALAMAAAAVVFAVVALDTGGGETTVGTAGQPGPAEGIVDDSDTAPATAVVTTTIPASTMSAYNAVQSAVTQRLPRFPITLDVNRSGSATRFEFGNEGDDGTLSLNVYDDGAFVLGEMESLPELETGTEDRAWLGTDDPDLRSVYYLSESGLGLRVASDAAGTSKTLSVNDLVATAAELASDPAIADLVAIINE